MREAKNLLFAGIVNPYTKWALIGVAALLITVIFIVISIQFAPDFSESETIKQLVTDFNLTDFLMFALVGFLAQIVDGALGMAYGISSTTFLLSLGLPPASASASVHAAEVVTSGASGLSHLKFKNVNKKLFRSLVIPGVIGAVIGAYFLSSIDGKEIKPYIAAYLMIMGLVVIYKALQKNILKTKTKNIGPLAFFGGLVDAIGGGGWGPVVVSNLLSKGRNPRYTIGSVNLAEFFIALAGASTFTLMLGINNWIVVVGLMAGGVFASPFAAYLCQKVNNRTLMLIVGFVIIFLSLRTIMLSIN
jgi:uncharacterized membrane protein YfcA